MTKGLKGQNCKFFTIPLSRNSQKRLEHKVVKKRPYNTIIKKILAMIRGGYFVQASGMSIPCE